MGHGAWHRDEPLFVHHHVAATADAVAPFASMTEDEKMHNRPEGRNPGCAGHRDAVTHDRSRRSRSGHGAGAADGRRAELHRRRDEDRPVDLIARILRAWLETNAYLPVHEFFTGWLRRGSIHGHKTAR